MQVSAYLLTAAARCCALFRLRCGTDVARKPWTLGSSLHDLGTPLRPTATGGDDSPLLPDGLDQIGLSDSAVARHQRQCQRLGRRHDEPVPWIGEKRAGDQREGVSHSNIDRVEVHVGGGVESRLQPGDVVGADVAWFG